MKKAMRMVLDVLGRKGKCTMQNAECTMDEDGAMHQEECAMQNAQCTMGGGGAAERRSSRGGLKSAAATWGGWRAAVAGAVAALIAGGRAPIVAAYGASYILGLAGEAASLEKGEYSMLPTDTAAKIASVVKSLSARS